MIEAGTARWLKGRADPGSQTAAIPPVRQPAGFWCRVVGRHSFALECDAAFATWSVPELANGRSEASIPRPQFPSFPWKQFTNTVEWILTIRNRSRPWLTAIRTSATEMSSSRRSRRVSRTAKALWPVTSTAGSGLGLRNSTSSDHPSRSRRVFSSTSPSAITFEASARLSMYGAGGQKRISDDFVRNFRHPLPSLVKQRTIADFLDRETAKIDALWQRRNG